MSSEDYSRITVSAGSVSVVSLPWQNGKWVKKVSLLHYSRGEQSSSGVYMGSTWGNEWLTGLLTTFNFHHPEGQRTNLQNGKLYSQNVISLPRPHPNLRKALVQNLEEDQKGIESLNI